MSGRGLRALALAALSAALTQCAKDPTAFYVSVSNEWQGNAVAGPYARVEMALYDAGTGALIATKVHASEVTRWPFTFTIDSSGDHDRLVIEVKVYSTTSGGDPTASGRAMATFVTNQVMNVPLTLSGECRTTREGLGVRPGTVRPLCMMGMLCGPPLSACDASQTCKITTPGAPPTCVTADAGTLTRRVY